MALIWLNDVEHGNTGTIIVIAQFAKLDELVARRCSEYLTGIGPGNGEPDQRKGPDDQYRRRRDEDRQGDRCGLIPGFWRLVVMRHASSAASAL